jgi:hypothetical protein
VALDFEEPAMHPSTADHKERLSTSVVKRVGSRAPQLRWNLWQRSVIALLRADFTGVLRTIATDEVDWESWRRFYEAGRSPQQAINRALERDW